MSVGCSARVTQEQGIWQPIAFQASTFGGNPSTLQ